MAIHRTQILRMDSQLSDLGVESLIAEDCTIILKFVQAWHGYNQYDEFKTCVSIDGNDWVINTPFEVFDKIMTQFLKDNEG